MAERDSCAVWMKLQMLWRCCGAAVLVYWAWWILSMVNRYRGQGNAGGRVQRAAWFKRTPSSLVDQSLALIIPWLAQPPQRRASRTGRSSKHISRLKRFFLLVLGERLFENWGNVTGCWDVMRVFLGGFFCFELFLLQRTFDFFVFPLLQHSNGQLPYATGSAHIADAGRKATMVSVFYWAACGHGASWRYLTDGASTITAHKVSRAFSRL